MPDAAVRFRYMMEYEPKSREDFQPWLEMAAKSMDPLYFVVIDKKSGKVAGRQTFMRVDTQNGVVCFKFREKIGIHLIELHKFIDIG